MSIKTKLFILIGLFTVLVIGLGLDLALIDYTVSKEAERDEISSRAVANVFELNVLAAEYAASRDSEIEDLWNEKYIETRNILNEASEKFEYPGGLAAISTSERDIESMKSIFDELTLLNSRLRFSGTEAEAAAEDAIVEDLFEQSEETAVSIEQLNTSARKRDAVNRRMLVALSLILVSLLVVATIAAATIFINNFIQPLNRGREVINKLAKGDFDIEISEDIINRKDEIGELGRDFATMLLKLREADRVKSEFASLASHELRNPLSAIIMNLEYLGMMGNASNKEVKRCLERVNKEASRMLDVVNTMMSSSIIELGSIDASKQKIDAVKIVKDEVKNLNIFARSKGVKVKSKLPKEEPVFAYTDSSLLRIVVSNLLSNAIKYSPDGGTVVVSVETQKNNKDVDIIIKDSGKGIPKKDQKKVFDKKFRARNVFAADASESDGAGLGLYTVKYLVSVLDGSIWFESKEGAGTSFFIRLPAKKSSKFRKA